MKTLQINFLFCFVYFSLKAKMSKRKADQIEHAKEVIRGLDALEEDLFHPDDSSYTLKFFSYPFPLFTYWIKSLLKPRLEMKIEAANDELSRIRALPDDEEEVTETVVLQEECTQNTEEEAKGVDNNNETQLY
jgi:hypothetical protein